MQTDERPDGGELQQAREQLENARTVSAKLHAELECVGKERAQERVLHEQELAKEREEWGRERAEMKREQQEALGMAEAGKKLVEDELRGVKADWEEVTREREEAVDKLAVEKQTIEKEVLALRLALEQAGETKEEREKEWAKERAQAKEEKLLFQEEMLALRDEVETQRQNMREEREREMQTLEEQVTKLKASLVSVAEEREREREEWERERGDWEREKEREKSQRAQAWEEALKERAQDREVCEDKVADSKAELRRLEAELEREREEGARVRSERAQDREVCEGKVADAKAELRRVEAELEREREEGARTRRELEDKLAGLQTAVQSVEQESQAKDEVVRLRALCDELEEGRGRLEEEWAAIEEEKQRLAGVEECWAETLRREEVRLEEHTAHKLEEKERLMLEQRQLMAERAELQEQVLSVQESAHARESELQALLAAEGERVKALEATVQAGEAELLSARSALEVERIRLSQELENQRRASEAEQALAATQVGAHEYARELEAQIEALKAQMEELRVGSERERQEHLEAARQNDERIMRERQVLVDAKEQALTRAGQVACAAQERLHDLNVEQERLRKYVGELEEARAAAERERDTHVERLTRESAERLEERRRHAEEVLMLTQRVERQQKVEAHSALLHAQIAALNTDVSQLQRDCNAAEAEWVARMCEWEASERGRLEAERQLKIWRTEAEVCRSDAAKSEEACASVVDVMVVERMGEKEQEFARIKEALEHEVVLLRRNLEELRLGAEETQVLVAGDREQEREMAVIEAQEEYGKRMAEWEKEVEALKSDALVLQAHVERYATSNEKLKTLASDAEARAVRATQVGARARDCASSFARACLCVASRHLAPPEDSAMPPFRTRRKPRPRQTSTGPKRRRCARSLAQCARRGSSWRIRRADTGKTRTQ